MPSLTIVIPMQNEAGNVAPVIDEVAAAMHDAPEWEIVAVDDGSTDDTLAELVRAAERHPRLRVLSNASPAGKSGAVHNGVLAARSRIVCMMDGDGQNPARELEKLWRPLVDDPTGRLGLVNGQRVERRDTFSKRAASRLANALRARLLNDGTRDTGSGLKGFRREAWLALPYFDNMHRYVPALFRRDGWEVLQVDVEDRERTWGRSKFTNLGRAVAGVFDLIGVAWLIHRRRKSEAHEIELASRTRAAE